MFSVALFEWRQVSLRLGGWQGIALYAGLMFLLGYLVPSGLGLDFLDPHIVLAYACLGPFFVTSVAAESFFDSREPVLGRPLLFGKVFASTMFGWVSCLLAMTLGLATVNLRHDGPPVLPSSTTLSGAAVLGLNVVLLAVSAAAVLALRSSGPRTVKLILRRSLLWTLLVLFLLIRFGQAEWKDSFTALLTEDRFLGVSATVSTLTLAVSVLLLILAMRHPRYSGPFDRT